MNLTGNVGVQSLLIPDKLVIGGNPGCPDIALQLRYDSTEVLRNYYGILALTTPGNYGAYSFLTPNPAGTEGDLVLSAMTAKDIFITTKHQYGKILFGTSGQMGWVDNARMVITPAGRVGINTISPDTLTKLEINGKVRIDDLTQQGYFMVTADSNGILGKQAFGESCSPWCLIGNDISSDPGNFLGTISNDPLIIKTNNTQKMIITPPGAVGISNSLPKNLLSVGQTIGIDYWNDDVDWQDIRFNCYDEFNDVQQINEYKNIIAGHSSVIQAANGSSYGSLLFAVSDNNTTTGSHVEFLETTSDGQYTYYEPRGMIIRSYGDYTTIGIGNFAEQNSRLTVQGKTIDATMHAFSVLDGGKASLFTVRNDGNVGMGTDAPDNSALLEMNSKTKGLLIPRMTLDERDERYLLNTAATGLMIYQTDPAPGFYYWDGSAWQNLLSSGNAWTLTGNTGTDPQTNFLGTTDEVDLVVKTYNQPRLTIKSDGKVQIGDHLFEDNNADLDQTLMLSVKGAVAAQEVLVDMTSGNWSDFVFNPDYPLMSLYELEKYILANKHLPDIPPVDEVRKNGLNLAKMDALLLQKIEEVNLYVIELQKQIDQLKKEREKQPCVKQ